MVDEIKTEPGLEEDSKEGIRKRSHRSRSRDRSRRSRSRDKRRSRRSRSRERRDRKTRGEANGEQREEGPNIKQELDSQGEYDEQAGDESQGGGRHSYTTRLEDL